MRILYSLLTLQLVLLFAAGAVSLTSCSTSAPMTASGGESAPVATVPPPPVLWATPAFRGPRAPTRSGHAEPIQQSAHPSHTTIPPAAVASLIFADGCPGAAITMAPGDFISGKGTTVGMADDFRTDQTMGVWRCGDMGLPGMGGAPDVAIAITLPVAGVLRVEVDATSSGFDPAIYIRPGSCSTEYACDDFSGAGGREVFLAYWPAGTYEVIIDGHGGTLGKFQFSASFDLAACGDQVVEPGEQCDTGDPPTAGDGCTACMADAPPAGTDTCPGQAVSVGVGTTLLTGTTIGYTNDVAGTCSFPPGGPDRVYAVTPTISGTLTATVGLDADGANICATDITSPGCWDAVLHARATCSDPMTEIRCGDQGAITPETVTFPVTGGVTYALFVDGYDDQPYSAGPFSLRLTLQ